jgi:hypothetical protein
LIEYVLLYFPDNQSKLVLLVPGLVNFRYFLPLSEATDHLIECDVLILLRRAAITLVFECILLEYILNCELAKLDALGYVLTLLNRVLPSSLRCHLSVLPAVGYLVLLSHLL